jgi:twitching motility two-component system response regulator PilH
MGFFNFGKKAPPAHLCVLHIDDSRWIRMPVAIILRRHFGMRVLEANSGPEGIDIAGREKPDIILLDIVMPGMDGFDALAKLKADDKTKNIPVIMCTARDQTREVNLAMRLGAVGYLTKPIEEDALIQKVDEVLAAMGRQTPAASAHRDLRVKPPPEESVHASGPEPADASAPELAAVPSPATRACSTCRGALDLIAEYNAWYCRACQKYPDYEA